MVLPNRQIAWDEDKMNEDYGALIIIEMASVYFGVSQITLGRHVK
jgi:hypothetical protein